MVVLAFLQFQPTFKTCKGRKVTLAYSCRVTDRSLPAPRIFSHFCTTSQGSFVRPKSKCRQNDRIFLTRRPLASSVPKGVMPRARLKDNKKSFQKMSSHRWKMSWSKLASKLSKCTVLRSLSFKNLYLKNVAFPNHFAPKPIEIFIRE